MGKETGDGISALLGREGPAGAQRKNARGEAWLEKHRAPESGVRGISEETCPGDSAA